MTDPNATNDKARPARFFSEGQGLSVVSLVWGFLIGSLLMGFLTCGGANKGSGTTTEDATETDRETQGPKTWTCSMHPQIQQPEAGSCALCGMDLIPAEAASTAKSHNSGGEHVPGTVLSKRARALAKIRTTKVVPRPGAIKRLQLMGRFEPDQMTVKTVTAWTEGWLEKLNVNLVGQEVIYGDVVAEIFSPKALLAHQELLDTVWDGNRRRREGRRARKEVEAARKRLRSLGASDVELEYLEQELRANSLIPVVAPITGTVLSQLITAGAHVSQGTPLFQIGDLSSTWLEVDVYERDLPFIDLGQHVEVLLEARPEEIFEGHISYVNPLIDEQSGIAKVRVQVNNRNQLIRPGMFARAVVTPKTVGPKLGALVIPATAPLITGHRALVFVEHASGEDFSYEARPVRLGPRFDDVYSVIAGLEAGERVVTQGAFVLDADLQIRGRESMMTGGDERNIDPQTELIPLSKEALKTLEPLFHAYLGMQAHLAHDRLEQVRYSGTAFMKALNTIKLATPHKAKMAWEHSKTILQEYGYIVQKAANLEDARFGFEQVSRVMIRLVARHGNPMRFGLRLTYCPIAFGHIGAYWLQSRDVVSNPFFGSAMPLSGEIQQRLGPKDFLMAPEKLEGRSIHPPHKHPPEKAPQKDPQGKALKMPIPKHGHGGPMHGGPKPAAQPNPMPSPMPGQMHGHNHGDMKHKDGAMGMKGHADHMPGAASPNAKPEANKNAMPKHGAGMMQGPAAKAGPKNMGASPGAHRMHPPKEPQ